MNGRTEYCEEDIHIFPRIYYVENRKMECQTKLTCNLNYYNNP